MEKNQIIFNSPVVKDESGLFLDPEVSKQKHTKKAGDDAIEKYQKRYNANKTAPTPDITVPYSYILTRATPPETKFITDGGLLLPTIVADVRMLQKLQIMSDNVSDDQEVLIIGPHVTNGLEVEPGDVVKINYNRYRRLHDSHTPGVIETEYEIPLYEIEGNEYLLIDARDVLYVKKQKK